MNEQTESVDERARRIVQQEVFLCLSSVVARLAELGDEEASEATYSVPDYEEAAIQEGWKPDGDYWVKEGSPDSYANAEECCEDNNLEPYDREVFEHWAVSPWLAARLGEWGERVSDVLDYQVWCRTTTGQAIYADHVLQDIAKAVLARSNAA